jgi:hypothetical protein
MFLSGVHSSQKLMSKRFDIGFTTEIRTLDCLNFLPQAIASTAGAEMFIHSNIRNNDAVTARARGYCSILDCRQKWLWGVTNSKESTISLSSLYADVLKKMESKNPHSQNTSRNKL